MLQASSGNGQRMRVLQISSEQACSKHDVCPRPAYKLAFLDVAFSCPRNHVHPNKLACSSFTKIGSLGNSCMSSSELCKFWVGADAAATAHSICRDELHAGSHQLLRARLCPWGYHALSLPVPRHTPHRCVHAACMLTALYYLVGHCSQ